MQWFHAHIYFNSPEERKAAVDLQAQIAALKLKTLRVYDLIDRAIGPHPVPMFEADFELQDFAAIVPWLMYNRGGLSILVHPLTEPELPNALKDHTLRPLWLGKELELKLDILRNLAAK